MFFGRKKVLVLEGLKLISEYGVVFKVIIPFVNVGELINSNQSYIVLNVFFP